MRMYYKLIVSTCYTFQNSQFRDIWKFMSITILSISMTLNLLTLWLLLYHFVFPNFSDALIITGAQHKYAVYIYVLLYFFLPMVLLNWFCIASKERLDRINKRYSLFKTRKYFRVHFLMSYLLAYIMLMLVI